MIDQEAEVREAARHGALPDPPGSRAKEPPPRWVRSPADKDRSAAPVIADALAWVEQHQSLAMLGAFASGVFIGVLMRR